MCAETPARDPTPVRAGKPGLPAAASLAMIAIDLDGTLVDSVSDLHHAVNVMLHSRNRAQVPESRVREWVGNGIDRLVHRALTGSMQGEAEPQEFEQAASRFRSAYADALGNHSCLYPGVAQGLDWLHSCSLPMVVVTNKDGRFSERLLQQLDIRHYFVDVIGGDAVSARKPDPEGLLLAAERCAAAPESCLLIGDSVSDFRAAKAAGFHSVGVSYGYNHGQPIDALPACESPDALIDSFLALPSLLGQEQETES